MTERSAVTRQPRESYRLTFRFDKESIELVAQERLRMIAPPVIGELPQAEVQGGNWLDLLDNERRRISAYPLSNPFETHLDYHTGEGRIEHYEREIGEGTFDVLIPAVDGLASVAFFSNEFGARADSSKGAVEIAHFELDQNGKERAS